MSAGKKLKALVFLGSVRDGRNVTRVAKFVVSKLQAANFETEILDPVELDIPLLKQPLHFFPNPSQAPPILQQINDKIKSADAFVVLTAEYNRQLPPALTNLMDHFPPRSYAFKSSAIVCYSMGAGGTSALAQARTLMTEFGAPSIPYILHIQDVMKKLDESGNPSDEYLHKSAAKMTTQLQWYATALRNHRQAVGEPDWPASTVSV